MLDEPLKPGDYQITLRATPKGGAAVMSLETAVLSIPETPGGQVLAMVEEPGKASELLTVPEPAAPAAPKTDEAAAPPAETPAEPKAEEAATPPAETPAEPKVEEAAAPPAEAGQPATADAIRCCPKRPRRSTRHRRLPMPASRPKSPRRRPIRSLSRSLRNQPRRRWQRLRSRRSRSKATRSSSPASPIPAATFASTPTRSCSAKPGRPHGGRFLVEAEHDLAVGNYIIRADVLDADGIEVIARAAVPFEREPGESIAAVAPPADAAEPARSRPLRRRRQSDSL